MSVLEVLPSRPRTLESRTRAPIVLVAGGKGGVGKTTIAVNVALALAKRGKRTLLVDLDLGLADTHVLLEMSAPRTVEDALNGKARFEECIQTTSHGLHVLPASSGTPEMGLLSPERRVRLCTALRDLARSYDFVIADASSGIGPDVLAFCGLADHVLVVTTPDPASLTDAYGLIKAIHTSSTAGDEEVATPELVVNRAAGLEEAESVSAKLRQVCERFLSRSPRSAGWLPGSGAVELAARFQRPFALDPRPGLALTCLEALAQRISRLGARPEGLSGCSSVS